MDALLAEVSGPAMGGVVTFTGVVRNQARGAEIDHLEYEAYAPMAERELRKIRDAIARAGRRCASRSRTASGGSRSARRR